LGFYGYQPRNRLITSVEHFSSFLTINPIISNQKDYTTIALTTTKCQSPYSTFLNLPLYRYDKNKRKIELEDIGDFGLIDRQLKSDVQEKVKRIRNFNQWKKYYYWNSDELYDSYFCYSFSSKGDKIALYPATKPVDREGISILSLPDLKTIKEIALPYSLLLSDEDDKNKNYKTINEKDMSLVFSNDDSMIFLSTMSKIFVYNLEFGNLLTTISIPSSIKKISPFVAFENGVYCSFYNEELQQVECRVFFDNSIKLEIPFYTVKTAGRYIPIAVLLPEKNKIAILEQLSKSGEQQCRVVIYNTKNHACEYEQVLNRSS
jgi:hypothetical protein